MTKERYEELKQEHGIDEAGAQAAFDFVLHVLEENKDVLSEDGEMVTSSFTKVGAVGVAVLMMEASRMYLPK